MQKYIQKIGLENIENYNLNNKREIFELSDLSESSIKNLCEKFCEKYKVKNFNITYKSNTSGFFMPFHMDGYQIHKVKSNQFELKKKFDVKYTLIIYNSTYDKDFKGGILEFVDGLKIYPKEGLCVFFDSRDVHKVNLLTNGIRHNFLIKFYD